MVDETVSQMLKNHKAKTFAETGDDSRGGTEAADRVQPEPEDLIWEEIDAVYDEYPHVSDILAKDKVHIEIRSYKRRHGVCWPNRKRPIRSATRHKGHYALGFADKIVGEIEHNWRNTVRHELAHALCEEEYDNPQSHGDKFKGIACSIGAKGTRCASTRHTTDYNYFIVCVECGNQAGRFKKSKAVKQAYRYSCGNCETTLSSHSVEKERPERPGQVVL